MSLKICDFSVLQLFVSGQKQFPVFVPPKNVQCRINVYGQPQSLLEIEVLNSYTIINLVVFESEEIDTFNYKG